jgi:NADH:ubiquinone oxidoreductase subunit 6 (subunit J)
MKKFFQKFGAAGLFFLLAFAPGLARADNGIFSGLDLIRSLFGSGISQDTTLSQLILDIIQILLTFAGPVAVLFVVVGGFYYITSGGNQERAEKGKQTLLNAIIGIVIVVLSYTIVTVIQNTVVGP